MVKAMDMPVHNIHGFCHASMGNVMAWQNSYYMTFVMLYEFCHAAWLLPYNPLFDPWHAVSPAYLDLIVNKSRSHHFFWLFFIFTSVRRFAALLIRDRNLWTQQSSPSVATEKTENQIINGLTCFPGSTYSHPGSTFPTWHQNWHHAFFLPTESSPWKDYWYFDLVVRF